MAGASRRGGFLGLDALAVDDVLGNRGNPKLDTIGDTVIIIGGGVCSTPSAELDIDRVLILATERVLVVLAADEQLLSTGWYGPLADMHRRG